MTRTARLILLFALLLGTHWYCSGTVEPELIPDGISVQYNGPGSVGGLLIELPDAEDAIDSTDVIYLGSRTGYTIVRIGRAETEAAWRILVLRKRGALEMGKLLGLTPKAELYSDPAIIDACDTSGVRLSLTDFTVSLVQTD